MILIKNAYLCRKLKVMEGIIGIILIFLLFRFGGSLIDGVFDAVGAMGKGIGIVVGIVLVIMFLMGGC